MNVLEKVLKRVKETKSFPVVITNYDYPIIEESSLICQALENEGYKVESFADPSNSAYGIKVSIGSTGS